MKALSKLKAEEGIWMTDVPVPELGHNDLLIKIRKTAICGTDVHIYNWDEWSQKTIPVPGNDSNLLIVFYVQRAFTDKQQIKRKAQSFD